MTAVIFEPEAILLRYPTVTLPERDALVRWVRGMDARTLVGLLADRRTERQLLALRAREPKLQVNEVGLILPFCALLLLAALMLFFMQGQ